MRWLLIQLLYFVIITASATFSFSYGMTDTYVLPKWLYTLGLVAVAGILASVALSFKWRRTVNEKLLLLVLVFVSFSQSVYAIVQAAGFAGNNFAYKVVGGFENPAGLASCLSGCVPFCVLFIQTNNSKILKSFAYITFLFTEIALLLSGSRAGIFAGGIFQILLWTLGYKKHKWIKWFCLSLLIIVLPLMFVVKKDSASGRLLMLQCGLEMIKERPINGFGPNGISKHYMNFQAEWLKNHQDSDFVLLADNVKHVFNEYITIAACFGFVGLTILICFICLMVRCYLKYPSVEGKCALMSLAAIGILGCFSYPLYYPFTWIILIVDSCILLSRAYSFDFLNVEIVKYLLAIVFFLSSSVLFCRIAQRIYAEKEWCRIANTTIIDEKKMNEYEMLMPILGDYPYFLYNYSAVLYINGFYEKSLEIALKCKQYWADYDLERLLGELYEKHNQYGKALEHFETAHNMCPNRFVPLYKQFKIYKAQGDTAMMISIGNEILAKRVKVPSRKIDIILNNVRYELQKISNNS